MRPSPNAVEAIADVIGINKDRVKITSLFIEDLGADSLDLVEMLMKFEDDNDIEITDEEAEKCHTVREALQLLDRKGASPEYLKLEGFTPTPKAP